MHLFEEIGIRLQVAMPFHVQYGRQNEILFLLQQWPDHFHPVSNSYRWLLCQNEGLF